MSRLSVADANVVARHFDTLANRATGARSAGAAPERGAGTGDGAVEPTSPSGSRPEIEAEQR